MSNSTANRNVDLRQVFSADSQVKIGEGDRLKFAKQVLFFLGIICIGIFVSYGLHPENEALTAMFELVKIGALPLVTLIVSFYFPKSNG